MASIALQILGMVFCSTNLISTEECSAGFYARKDYCTREAHQRSIGWNTTAICEHITQDHQKESCSRNSSCGKHFRVSVFDQQLFAITMKNTFIDMLTRCCKQCARCSVVNEIEHTMHLSESVLRTSDVIFPVLSGASVNRIHGFHFLEVFRVPSSYYFTRQKSSYTILIEVIAACLGQWPFLLMCLLFASISGFFVWLIETRMNRDDFPRRFFAGIFDGFWWSFISMTTVGFGDKVTKSYLGKTYAVVWILVGVTICSMFTASLTSEILRAREPASTDMSGKDVAVLKGRMHDVAVVADHGGIVHIGNSGQTMEGISEMITLLEKKSIHGFLMDRNTFYHFSERTKEVKYKRAMRRMKGLNMAKATKQQVEGDLSCGMMFKDFEDYKYFKAYFDNNRLDIRSCNSASMNTKCITLEKDSYLFNADSRLFEIILQFCIAILVLAVIIGFLPEGRRYYMKIKSDDEK